ncbi:MerR family transcriptional regulator [Phyllobacterium calauticae]|jgi:DNA-binding transcriptional MerR regulator|uniref:MerR family transcriptional regulator n=1 Tax=Phyllobacterium calauticae TaxID=2817027 RepID=UPI001CC0E170|nr:MerR family transcriptional regulator [Phyllobacterium calauticae]MBZ3695615.1 MerR family transcriptional regulator [Phyllobacterium calauticae]
MDKSPDAFRTISEVAEDLDLPQHVLRFWETRFTHIKPMKRGGGRRYYRPLDVDLLKGIRHLLYDQGYTIKGVQRLLRENGAQFIIALGSGDTAAAEAISQQKQAAVREEEAHSAEQERADAAEEAAVMGSPKSSSHGRRLFGLIKGDDDGPVAADGKRLSKDNRTLLQETLFDLLECKRLLDQVR